jgi:hypothetical protein
MTDDDKEVIFNTLTRWLRDSNFLISEERLTVVTSEFYAKASLQSDLEHYVEIVSSHGIKAHFILRIRLKLSEKQLAIYDNIQFKENPNLDDKMNTIIFPQRQTFNIRDKSAFLEKAISIDPKSIDAKKEILLNVSNLIESATKVEIWFSELISDRMR